VAYNEILLVEAPGAEVLDDSVEVEISVPSVLPFTGVDEWL
jgi:hypothetical protein